MLEKQRQVILIGVGSLLMVTTSLCVAQADVISEIESIGSLNGVQKQVNQVQQYADEFNSYLSSGRYIYKELTSSNFSKILKGFNQIRGVLGIPDPYEARQEQIDQAKDNPADGQSAANVVDRGVAAGISDTEALGQDGQKTLDETQKQVQEAAQQAVLQVDDANTALASAQTLAQDSKTRNVTQKVMKNISQQLPLLAQQTQVLVKQQAYIAQIDQHHSEQLASLQKIGAGSLLTQSNISATLDQQAQMKQLEDDNSRHREVQASAAIYFPKLPDNASTSVGQP